jgi:hypothetical protein
MWRLEWLKGFEGVQTHRVHIVVTAPVEQVIRCYRQRKDILVLFLFVHWQLSLPQVPHQQTAAISCALASTEQLAIADDHGSDLIFVAFKLSDHGQRDHVPHQDHFVTGCSQQQLLILPYSQTLYVRVMGCNVRYQLHLLQVPYPQRLIRCGVDLVADGSQCAYLRVVGRVFVKYAFPVMVFLVRLQGLLCLLRLYQCRR